jgi:DNA-binding SARP family transcriptional activator
LIGAASLTFVPPSDQTTELLTAGKPLGLLIYLALSPGCTATREHMIDLLWADSEPDGARHALRQAIWFLHQRIGGQAIVASNINLTLAHPIDSDRDAFVAAIERRDFENAVELYHGDFLPGFAAPGGADFEHWADLERDRLGLMFHRVAETVVRDWLSRGRLRKARQLATRVRDQYPHDERAWRLLLETLLAANDSVQLELEADALERLLHYASP